MPYVGYVVEVSTSSAEQEPFGKQGKCPVVVRAAPIILV